MAKNHQLSFRRILVTKILLIFVPVLLVGEIIALNKARSSLLKTAKQNLTESAINQGDKISQAIAHFQTNLLITSQTTVIQSNSSTRIQNFINQLAQKSPTQIDCIQLQNWITGKIIASSCGNQVIAEIPLSIANQQIDIRIIPPPKTGTTGQRDDKNQLKILLSTPIYNQRGNLAHVLKLQTTLYQNTSKAPGSLIGSLMVIDENGVILAHPLSERIGTNIEDHPDAERLNSLVKNAIDGRTDSSNLYFTDNQELVAGYTAIPSPITQNQKWVILAVTSVENALFGLEEIKLILIVLMVGLIGASLLASLYLVPDLAGPVEELRDYALNVHSHHAAQPTPHNFKIKELNQLAQAIDQMVERLKDWAEEIEIAWKEAKKANQVKSQFLATTSHELRNPLNIIINCVRLVREDMCDSREEELEFLKKADDTAIHLLGIINDLLDISKIEAGKLSVVTTPTDLRQLLLEVINLQSVNIQHQELQLICKISNEIIPVKVDAVKLKQVLINIIGNATKFTEEGSITVKTEIEHFGSKSQVIVSVKDTGIGIEPSQQHKLFRPFVMVDGSNTRKFEGTGLGLAISRNLIELMGGKITLESLGLHQGTTVKITLPLIDISLLSHLEKKSNLEHILDPQDPSEGIYTPSIEASETAENEIENFIPQQSNFSHIK
ncbi:MAG TPA: ATP-binding protein [Nostocaceae cyanobacterium]|nr:ATP-binding protein [Nostocaceae cyanobacterium]